jgi:stage V sporulation protein SpoVS
MVADPIVLDAHRTDRGWHVVLAVHGAANAAVAQAAVREALAVAAGFDPPTALDLIVVDPDDATIEVRAVSDVTPAA